MLEHYGKNTSHFGPFAIVSEDGTFLGLTGGDFDDSDQGTYEIWYFIQRDHWAKKIATKAVSDLIQLMRASGVWASSRSS